MLKVGINGTNVSHSMECAFVPLISRHTVRQQSCALHRAQLKQPCFGPRELYPLDEELRQLGGGWKIVQ